MRVSISGTHSSGKTSLLRTCQDGLRHRFPNQVDLIREVARDVIRQGHPLNQDATIESYLLYVQLQLEAERLAMKRHVVSDRSLVDLLAYVETNADPGIPAGLADMLREILWVETKYFDVYCYLPVEFPLMLDGVRPVDIAYQAAVDARLRDILSRYGVSVMRVTGSVASRSRQLLALFEDLPY